MRGKIRTPTTNVCWEGRGGGQMSNVIQPISFYLFGNHLIVANGGQGIVIMMEGRECSGNDVGEGVWW